METKVLVVGAGPVGLFLAASLRRLGVEVRIVEAAAEPSGRSKALVVWPRTLEMLEIEGCVAPFLEAGLRGGVARIMAGRATLAEVSLATAPSAYPFALFLPQSETERLLGEELARVGGQVERGVALGQFSQDGEGVTAELVHAAGRSERLRVGWMVGCDGAHSTVRHGLDLPFTGVSMPSTWLLADVRVDGPLGIEVSVSWSPEGVLAVFPIEPGRFRIIGDIGAAARSAPPSLAEVQALVERRGPGGLVVHDPVWLATFRINERKVASYRSGQVFLAGDAAHIHSPAGGQGMNTGLQDAANLAWKLALVCHGRARKDLLDSYSVERSAIGDIVLRRAGRMTRVAITRNRLLQVLRNRAVGVLGGVPAFRRGLVEALSGIDLRYRTSPLNGQGMRGRVHPGARIVLPGLAPLLHAGRFVVLNGAVLPERLAGIAVNGFVEGVLPGAIDVIRPDGYLAMSATEDVVALDYLSRLL